MKYSNLFKLLVSLTFFILSCSLIAMKRPRVDLTQEDLQKTKKIKTTLPILLAAIMNNDLRAFNTIVSLENINEKYDRFHNVTPLFVAIAYNRVAIVVSILDYAQQHNIDLKLNDKQGPHHLTPLCNAAQWGYTSMVKAILDFAQRNNVDLNLNEKQGISNLTLLYVVSQWGYTSIVKAILDFAQQNNIDLNLNEKQGHDKITLLYAVTQWDHTAIAKAILNFAQCNNIDLNLNEKQGQRNLTLLAKAAKNNHAKVARMLLEHKATIDIPDSNALDYLTNSREIAELLIEYGEIISYHNRNLITQSIAMISDASRFPMNTRNLIAFIIAKNYAHFDILMNQSRQSIAPYPIRFQDKLIAKLVNNSTASGWTPLMWTAARNNVDALRKLLNLRDSEGFPIVETDIQNNKGETALDLAHKHNKREAAQLIYNYLQPRREIIDILLKRKNLPVELTAGIIGEFIYGIDPQNIPI